MSDPTLTATPLHEVVNHPKVQEFVKKMSAPKFQVDASLIDEIQNYVSIAKERREQADKLRLPTIYRTKEDIHALAAFIVEVQANRDRVIEIKLSLLPTQRMIQRILKEATAQLYHFEAVAKASPAPMRDSFMEHILAPIHDAASKINMVIEAAAEADRHLGNAWFSLKELRAIGTLFVDGGKAQEGV